MTVALLQPLAGLALFLFALRFLHQAIDESLARRIKPILLRLDRGLWRPLLAGFLVTLVLQASSITIMATMALSSHRLLRVNSALLIMFGATIGTATKSLLFSFDIISAAYALIVISGFGFFFFNQPFRRRILELLFSVGFMFLGWDMIRNGLAPLADQINLIQLLSGFKSPGFVDLLGFFFICMAFTAIVQSSSTMVLVLISLSQTSDIHFGICLAGLLGANVGTTVTALIASLEYRTEVKRIAVGHLLIKLIGAFATLLMLPLFINFLELLYLGTFNHFSIAERISLAHIGFNLLNVAVWILLFPALLRLLEKLLPVQERGQKEWLADPVRRMLNQVPDMAIDEASNQWQQFKQKVKVLEDETFEMLTKGQYPESLYDISEIHKELMVAEELLLNALCRDRSQSPKVISLLTNIRNLKLMVEDLERLRSYIESLAESERNQLIGLAAQLIQEVDSMRNEFWQAIFADSKMAKSRKRLDAVQLSMEHNLSQVVEDNEWLEPRQLLSFQVLTTQLLGYTHRALALAGQQRPQTSELGADEGGETAVSSLTHRSWP